MAFVSAGWAIGAEPPARPPAPIDYNRSIRPILSNNCFKCHGPDAKERQSGLRLDVRDAALKPAELGERAIVPGKAAESELIKRVTSADDDYRMPPAETKKQLSAAEKDLLKTWIDQGAKYQTHWAFIAPVRPPLPAVKNSAWPKNAIDYFILARLEAEGLAPSPEADRTTLIRRLSFDLIGLPPTPAEVDAFLADVRPDAYERLADRLLSSPRYGERMALDWLDAARFADTHGYHIDSGRDMTRWREWVIDAFNRNMPFDRFTVEQLAGDLLPNATVSQRIASGFNRNHMINFEGGAIPEEYHNAYIVDRVNTTGTVFLGLTVACMQCHDHKYDPMTQREFYQLYAFFHNLPENGLDGSQGNAVPLLKAPSTEQQGQLDALAAEIKAAQDHLAGPLPEIDRQQAEWEVAAARTDAIAWNVLHPTQTTAQGGATLTVQPDQAIVVSGANPPQDAYVLVMPLEQARVTALRIEALTDESLTNKGPGRSVNGNTVLTGVTAEVVAAGPSGAPRPLKFKAASADFSQKDFPASYIIDDNAQSGWAILPEMGKPHAAVLEFNEPLAAQGSVLTLTLQFRSPFGQHQFGKFRASATDAANPHAAGKLPPAVAEALAVAADGRTDAQRAALRGYYRASVSPDGRKLNEQLLAVNKTRADLEARIPTAMVMQDMPQPRDTFILARGQYDKKGEKVSAGVPAFLPPLSGDAPRNRLGLARWLVDPAHPLVARVTVNRFWQSVFGSGLVKTAEDFGTQGELPSHAELLDWLAVEFREASAAPPVVGDHRGWNVKGIVKLLVTSATYRQASFVTPALHGKDPENRLLARGSRYRLQAEMIRDQALAISGLLNDEIGGRSVSPYQPAGIWEELAYRDDGRNWTAQTYSQSHGRDLYRRTMYTFWKRTAPPPALMTFDAPDREVCTVRRSRTNTPLQALVLMNDPTYVEAARKLAERMMLEGGATPPERIAFALRMATARRPSEKETAVLTRIFERQLEAFRKDAGGAAKLLSVGEAPRNDKLDVAELAAWTTVASVILNLDETLSKG